MNFELHNNAVDFHFIAPKQPGVVAVAMRTSLAELHGLVFFLAAVAPSHGRDGVDFHLASLQQVFLVGGPTPAVGEQMGHHGRYLADVHHHTGDMLHVILLRHCFDVLDNIKYDSEFVHVVQFSVVQLPLRVIDSVECRAFARNEAIQINSYSVISCSVFLAEDDFSSAFEHVG